SIAINLPIGGGVPPVLRPDGPAENRVITLPGPPKPAPVMRRVKPIAPVARALPTPSKLPLAALPPVPVMPKPVAPPKPALPIEMAREVAFYCQHQIGQWKEADAAKMLGEPLRSRPAYDENKAVSGKIQAFRDPTGHYKELELDFD